jgi:hypothetical protein
VASSTPIVAAGAQILLAADMGSAGVQRLAGRETFSSSDLMLAASRSPRWTGGNMIVVRTRNRKQQVGAVAPMI